MFSGFILDAAALMKYLLTSDCSAVCTEGVLSENCSHCVCNDSVIYGQVLSDEALPLDNVTITPENAPYAPVATSILGGYFNVSDGCDDDSYEFSREGYVNTVVNLSGDTNVTMQQVGMISYTILVMLR